MYRAVTRKIEVTVTPRFVSERSSPSNGYFFWAYTIDITNPGSETSLATTQLTLATDDRWIVMLTTSIEGELVLQAAKQP